MRAIAVMLQGVVLEDEYVENPGCGAGMCGLPDLFSYDVAKVRL